MPDDDTAPRRPEQPVQPEQPEQPVQPTGATRVRQALRGPVSRGQVVAAVLLAALGFAAVVQVRANGRDDNFTAASQQDLIAFINTLTTATDRTENELADLQRNRDALLSDTEARRTALELARRRADTLGILAGTLPASGPGVRVVVRDPSGSVGTDQVVEGLQELRDAGAEVIEINDQVRVVAQTAVVDGTTGVVVDGIALSPPYVIEAIGSPSTLEGGLDFQGGFVDDVAKIGGSVEVQQRDSIDITAVHAATAPRYAEPVPGE